MSDNIYYVLGCLLSQGDTGKLYPRVTIAALPDDVLLEIFEFYLDLDSDDKDTWLLEFGLYEEDAWHTLVHVCSTWRRLVFASPRRLNLQLLCKNTRPVRKMLNVWPELPIAIYACITNPRRPGTTNIIYALKQHADRVYKIDISDSPNPLLKKNAAVKKPFPALTDLFLSSQDEPENHPVAIPASFLGGSAPRLQNLSLYRIPFPALGRLLLSTRDLVTLSLYRMPRSGYISPEEIVTCISTLTRLTEFFLKFESPRSRAEGTNRSPPPLARVILPALTTLTFRGNSEYLEDTVSRIDTPLLHHVEIELFNQLVFDTPHLLHFIGRTEQFSAIYRATTLFSHQSAQIIPSFQEEMGMLHVRISCMPLDWQLSSLTQIYNPFLSPLRTLEHLCIWDDQELQPQFQDDIPENDEWLEFLQQFTSIKDLELSKKFVPLVLPALGDLTGERATEVLPALQNIFVEELPSSGPVQEVIDKFVASRQLSDCPVSVRQREINWQL